MVDQLTKKRYYILYIIDKNSTIAEITVYLSLKNIKKLYSLFISLTLDWNP